LAIRNTENRHIPHLGVSRQFLVVPGLLLRKRIPHWGLMDEQPLPQMQSSGGGPRESGMGWALQESHTVPDRSLSGVPSGCLFSPKPTHLADFNQVQTIQYSNSEDKDRKGMLQLKIAGAPEPLTVTAPSLTIAENMADLIDGYCRLVNGATQSFIIRPQKEGERALPSIPKLANSEKQGMRTHAVSVSGERLHPESPR